MFMGVIDTRVGSEALRHLSDLRVLITGVGTEAGADLARTFADGSSRLVIQMSDLSPDMTALVVLLTETAADVTLYTDPIAESDAARRFAQAAAQVYGGLDIAINIVNLSAAPILASDDPEAEVSQLLSPLLQVTEVVANRMRLLASEGLVLNVVTLPEPRSAAEQACATIVRATIAELTRGLADAWAANGIRINAVGPKVMDAVREPGAVLVGEPDVAGLAVYLATKPAKGLSGYTFDAVFSS